MAADTLRIAIEGCAVRNAQDLNCLSVPAKYREIGDFHEYYSGARTAPYLTIFVGGNHEASNYLWELYYGGWVAPNIYYLGAANVVRLGPLRIAALSGIWKGYNYKKSHYERLPYNQDDIKSIYHVREVDTRKLLQIYSQVDVGISHDWPRGIEWKGDWKQLFRKKNGFEADARDGTLGSVAAQLVMNRLRPAYWFSAHLHVKFAATLEDEPEVVKPTDQAVAEDPNTPVVQEHQELGNADEIDLDMDDAPTETQLRTGSLEKQEPHKEIYIDEQVGATTSSINIGNDSSATDDSGRTGSTGNDVPNEAKASGVPDDIRALLPASFAAPVQKQVPPKRVEPPPGVWNRKTRFLSLDKCLPERDFLQLLELTPLSGEEVTRPLQFKYDKEWLAIVRALADELTLSDSSASTPVDKGEDQYRSAIEKQEKWIEENIVGKGKMVIPENFQLTAPPFDPSQGTKVAGQPREYSNPQTIAFCELIQIPNQFHASEEEIMERANAGPRAEAPGSNRGTGGRGSFRGGFGRGRDRGRGRGRGGARGRGWR
ncbi:MAG: hypothetical protein M1820_008192 [Bogoriella megaspora]|nr:MAG: hypothetical protein M1820_008192 [Bogoriella megaspora]